MKGSKQTVKGQKLSPGYVQEALPRKKGVKVVDVRLTSKSRKAKQSELKVVGKNDKAPRGKAAAKTVKAAPAAAQKAAARRTRLKAVEKPVVAAAQSKKAPARTAKIEIAAAEKAPKAAATKAVAKARPVMHERPAPAKKIVEAAPEPIPAAPESLSLELLRPFREAARKNKQLQRERDRSRAKKSSFLAKPLKKGKKYIVDLRVHSPGSMHFFSTGGVDPAPALVRLAKVKGIDMIGLTDCYDASYIDAVKQSAAESGVTVLPGVELRCTVADCDEISILALFPESYGSSDVYRVLDELEVPKWAYGRNDYRISLSFAEVLRIIEGNSGIIIPSRVDKTPFRHLAIPTMVEEFGIHAFDLIHPDSPEFFREHWPEGQFTFFSFSNANALGQIGSRTSDVRLGKTGFEGIKELVQRRI